MVLYFSTSSYFGQEPIVEAEFVILGLLISNSSNFSRSASERRRLGKKAGALTFAGDLLKGMLAVFFAIILAHYTGADEVTSAYIAVVFVVMGHNWPAFLGFKGGKGVATSLGSMLGINPILALSCFAFFLIIVAVTKYVSLGSVLGICISPILMLITHNPKGVWVTLFLSLSVVYTHRANIKRLLNGTERKLGEKKQ